MKAAKKNIIDLLSIPSCKVAYSTCNCNGVRICFRAGLCAAIEEKIAVVINTDFT